MPLTVGTAGHIDHGKTWLVRALTGKDTDRLPEEQARGISIDLGYAPLQLADGRQFSLVDVPGHERFVRTMIAGATGIDLFLLVIDAQEGVRPQTLEHLAVLRLLGVERGVIAVTKSDAVDEETLELALAEAGELVPDAEVVAVSAKTGAGLDELRVALARVQVESRDASAATRLYVDRVFTLQGVGTIATGTLWSGTIAAGSVLRIEPQGTTVRVRSVQVHDTSVERAEAGQRVAVNLPAVERRELARGDVLVEPGHYPVSYRLDIRLEQLEEIPAAVTVHVGTKAVPARIVRDGEYAQLRLQEQVVAARGDRVVLRTEHDGRRRSRSRPCSDAGPRTRTTVGARRRNARGDRRCARPRAGDGNRAAGARAALPRRARARTVVGSFLGDYYFSEAWLTDLRAEVRMRLAARAASSPLDPGLPLAELLPNRPWAPAVLNLLELERRGAKAYLPGATAELGERADAAAELETQLAQDEIAKIDDKQLAAFLEAEGRIRRVGDGYAVSTALYDSGRELLPTLETITLASFRDALGVGRRTAQLLLERYDADGLTLRRGDVRTLRRRRRDASET